MPDLQNLFRSDVVMLNLDQRFPAETDRVLDGMDLRLG